MDIVKNDHAKGPAALYQQVKDFIAKRIYDGSLKSGDRVPSEAALVDQFGVSRMTVNRALRELASEGLVRRIAGVGTFVDRKNTRSNFLRIESIADEIRSRGERYSFNLVSLEKRSAPVDVALALHLKVGTTYFYSVCVHKCDDVPVQLEFRHVNPRVVPDYINQKFRDVSPGEYLFAAAPLTEIEHVVEAVIATAAEGTLLDLREGEPCLVVLRRTWSDGVPATYSRLVHPANRYRLGSRFLVHEKKIVG